MATLPMSLEETLEYVVDKVGAKLPPGFDSWGLKTVHADLTTFQGYRWPFPGSVATVDPDKILHWNKDACPQGSDDGLCVGLSWRAMASSGIPAKTLLLVAYNRSDVLGSNDFLGKLRCSKVAVVELIDGESFLQKFSAGMDLSFANLRGMNIESANWSHTNLNYAILDQALLTNGNFYWTQFTRTRMLQANLSSSWFSNVDFSLIDARGAFFETTRFENVSAKQADFSGASFDSATLINSEFTSCYFFGTSSARAVDEFGQWHPETNRNYYNKKGK